MSGNTAVSEPPSIKGWCPGALRPMRTGDGLIVRVRPRAGALSVGQCQVIAGLAQRHGNGHIDLTRRANLQIRGLSEQTLAHVWSELSACGLLDASAEAEAVRNVLLSPLAGLDPSEVWDVRPMAIALEELLGSTPALWDLPGKFEFLIDGGGQVSLDGETADIRLKVIHTSGAIRVALGANCADGLAWISLHDPADAPTGALNVAKAFLAVSDGRGRMRNRMRADIAEAALAHMPNAARHPGGVMDLALQDAVSTPAERHGPVRFGGTTVAVGIGAPFGRIEAEALNGIATLAESLGIAEVRLSPWRVLYVAADDGRAADALIAAAGAYGLIAAAGSSLMSIDACPGAPACRSGAIPTREMALRLAALMPMRGVSSVHVSGCSKGCARSKVADLVLVGTPSGFGVVRNGTAADSPEFRLATSDIERLPSLLNLGA